MSNNNSIIFIPFAWKESMQTGVNVAKQKNKFDMYMQNVCTALISAKWSNPDSNVALVINTDVPESYYRLLKECDVQIIQIPFDEFVFDEQYTWGLAFYKLCALYHLVREYDYEYYCYMDSDVYVQDTLEHVWKECDDKILLYDINHGLQVHDYQRFIKETHDFGLKGFITHYGGEFFAANKENALEFSEACKNIFKQMLEKNFVTVTGDEFILSVAANEKNNIKNAGAYIYRFWTGRFRLVSTNYKFNQISILHVPAEKAEGMLKVYKHYIAKRKKPSKQKVHRMLHLSSPGMKGVIKSLIGKILNRDY